jgi:hypothetical protein
MAYGKAEIIKFLILLFSIFAKLLFKWLFSKGCSFYVFFNQTVRVGSNFAKIEKSKIKNFMISALP